MAKSKPSKVRCATHGLVRGYIVCAAVLEKKAIPRHLELASSASLGQITCGGGPECDHDDASTARLVCEVCARPYIAAWKEKPS